MSCYGYGYGLGLGYGYGYGLGCCAPCLQCFVPKCVDDCPVVIAPGPIIPDPFCNIGDPCYGGIRAPAAHCSKNKACCDASTKTNSCKKTKDPWFIPGSETNCNSCCH